MSKTNQVFKGLTVEFRGDTSNLDESISALNKEFRGLRSEINEINKKLKQDPFNAELISQKVELLNKAIKIAQDRVKKWTDGLEALKSNQRDVKKQMDDLTKSVGGQNNLNEEQIKLFKELEVEYNSYEAAIDSANRSLKTATKDLDRFNNQLDRFRQQHYSDSFKHLANEAGKVEKVFSGLSKFTAPGSIAATGALTASAKAATDLEVALVAVNKVLKDQGTGTRNTKGFEQIKQEIMDLSTVIPVSVEKIAQAYANAAQLGVQNDDLQKFVETILRLDSATDIDASSGASTLAQFYNIIGGNIENIDNLGNALVRLGNNTATTESAILKMSAEIGASASQVKFTEAQILALAASLTSMGLDGAGAGTAISTVITDIDKAIDLGKAGEFAKVMGISADKLKTMWKSDAASTLVALIAAMKQASDSGKSLNLILDKLGITGIREDKTIKALVNNYDGLASAMNLAADAYENGSDAIDESQQAWDTFASNIQLLVNNLKIVAVELGNVILPLLMPFIDKIKEMAQQFAGLGSGAKEMIVKLLALVAVISPLMGLFGKLAGTAKGLFNTIALFVKDEGAIAFFSKIKEMFSGGLFSGLKSAFASLGGLKTLGIGSLIVFLAASLIEAWKSSEQFRNSVRSLWDNVKKLFETFKNLLDAVLGPLIDILGKLFAPVLEDLKNAGVYLWQAFVDLVDILVVFATWLIDVIIPVVEGLWDGILGPLADSIGTVLVGAIEAISAAIETVIGWAKDGVAWLKKLLGIGDEVDGRSYDKPKANTQAIASKNWGTSFGNDLVINSAGLGISSGGIGNISLSTSIVVNNNGEPIEVNTIHQWADTMTDIISENLGKRLVNV